MQRVPTSVSIAFLSASLLWLFFPAKPASAVDRFGSSLTGDCVDYQVIFDRGKTVVRSAGGGADILVEDLRRQIQEKAGNPGAQGSASAQNAISSVNFGINFFGLFYVRVHGPESHSLGTCVRTPVTHINVVVKRSRGTNDRDAWVNLHVGTYRSSGRRCFVFWESRHSQICWRLCAPSRSSLRDSLYSAMRSGGVPASTTLLWHAANILATVLWPLLIVL